MKAKIILVFVFLLFIALIYRNWFLAKEIIGGDWPYFYHENLQDFSLFPPAWSAGHGNGMGGIIIAYFLDQYLYFTVFIFTNFLKLPWIIVYKIFWFGLFLLLSVFSSGYLSGIILPKIKLWQKLLAALIYSTNTYILMVVGGGQMGIALAYSLAPLVLAKFIKIIRDSGSKIQTSVIAGLVLAIQLMFDPRIAYITMSAVTLSLIFSIKHEELGNKIFSLLFYALVIPIGTAILLSSYWIIPVLLAGSSPLPKGFENVSGFEFFSFADFSHTLSLLHPNWPENIFGKIYFMRWEFLFIPILAYSSLLFAISKIKNQNETVLFFAFLGLVGAFLAKGSNPPFGELNTLIYEHIPGMSLFRDSTKFYLWIILSYSILIPFTISELAEYCKKSLKRRIVYHLILIIFITFWLSTIHPAILGNLTGTFKNHTVPVEYIEIKNFLSSQPVFFRILWVPKRLRFSFSLQTHPAVEATELFGTNNSDELMQILKKPSSQNYLSQLSIKYVIIPYDSFSEYFLEDRKYSQEKRNKIEEKLDKISWLKKIISGKISVYETANYLDHFTLEEQGKISYQIISPAEYNLSVSTAGDNRLVFAENFNPWWVAKIEKRIIHSIKTENKFNSFNLPKGDYQVRVYYQQANFYKYGRIISLTTLILILAIIAKFRKYEI